MPGPSDAVGPGCGQAAPVWGAEAAAGGGRELPAQGWILELKTFQELTLNQIK